MLRQPSFAAFSALAWLLGVWLLGLAPALAEGGVAGAGEPRVALVMGNGAYRTVGTLQNPPNDAKAMADTLRELGFAVIEKEDATKAQMEDAIIAFGKRLHENSVGLVYYAGHGMQVAGKNYLVPVDAVIDSERAVPLRTIDADSILTQMQEAHSRINLVILDACRNNPFERSFRALGGGLAQMNAPQGSLIAYATAPGKMASDGDGSNGLYTQALLQAIRRPGLSVEQMFKQVRGAVSAASNGHQVPWESSSLTGDFFFNGPPPAASVKAEDEDRLRMELAKTQAESERLRVEATKAKQELEQAQARLQAEKGSLQPPPVQGASQPPPLSWQEQAAIIRKNIELAKVRQRQWEMERAAHLEAERQRGQQ